MLFDPDYICLATLHNHLGISNGCAQLFLVLRHELLQLVQQEVRVEVPVSSTVQNSVYVSDNNGNTLFESKIHTLFFILQEDMLVPPVTTQFFATTPLLTPGPRLDS